MEEHSGGVSGRWWSEWMFAWRSEWRMEEHSGGVSGQWWSEWMFVWWSEWRMEEHSGGVSERSGYALMYLANGMVMKQCGGNTDEMSELCGSTLIIVGVNG